MAAACNLCIIGRGASVGSRRFFALPGWLSLNPKKDTKTVPAYKKSSKQVIDGRSVNRNKEKKSMISTVAAQKAD